MRKAYLKIASVIIVIAIVGLSTVGDYGVSMDEPLDIASVKYNLELIIKGEPLPQRLKHYGILFHLTSELLFQAKEMVRTGFSSNPLKDMALKDPLKHKDGEDDRLIIKALYDRIQVKHPLTFLLSLITYVSVAGIVGILVGLEYAWLGPVVLVLLPRFWGHGFFNPKDIPFAAMFTLATFAGACLVGFFQRADDDVKLGFNRITLYALLYSILVGLVTGTRIAGLFLFFFVAIAHLTTSTNRGSIYRTIARFWVFYGVMLIPWVVTTMVMYPPAWSNPVGWFVETLQYFSKVPWPHSVFVEGEFVLGQSLPWHYLPKWLILTTPLITQCLFVAGLFLVIIKFKKLTALQRACAVLILLQIFFLPTVAILKRSTMYDGLRHFLFVLPGIAAIAATALVWMYQSISKRAVRMFAVVLICVFFSPTVFDMAVLHPYEYIYFNRISGGLAEAHEQYETDYWGLSLREGMEWINENARSNSLVVVGGGLGELFPAKIFSNPDLRVISRKAFRKQKLGKPDYYLAMPRWNMQREFSHCPLAYQVTRQGAPLSIVRKCR